MKLSQLENFKAVAEAGKISTPAKKSIFRLLHSVHQLPAWRRNLE